MSFFEDDFLRMLDDLAVGAQPQVIIAHEEFGEEGRVRLKVGQGRIYPER